MARSRGTLLHFHIEAFLNNFVIEGPPSPEFCQFLNGPYQAIAASSRVYRTEISLFHCGLRVAGQADCLCRDAAGNLVIWDWRTGRIMSHDTPFYRIKEGA